MLGCFLLFALPEERFSASSSLPSVKIEEGQRIVIHLNQGHQREESVSPSQCAALCPIHPGSCPQINLAASSSQGWCHLGQVSYSQEERY